MDALIREEALGNVSKSLGIITRRQACALAACALGGAVLGLGGCSQNETDSHAVQGFAPDTLVKDYPVSLKIYADSNLQWNPYTITHLYGTEGLDHLKEYVVRYQHQNLRSEVSIEITYVDWTEIERMAREGFPDGDGLVAMHCVFEDGNAAETIDGGSGNYLVRDFSFRLADRVTVVRAVGSDVQLPDTYALDGNDIIGEVTRFDYLPEFDGLIAIADPDVAYEGRMANMKLHGYGYYSESSGTGGAYLESIADKIRLFPSQDAAMKAVASETCQIGFALRNQLDEIDETGRYIDRYPGVETFYDYGDMPVGYSGAALTRSPEAGVVRDFFEFILACTD